MATRTCKLYGEAYASSGSVSLVVNFNGSEVHNGAVTTTAGTIPDPGTSTFTEGELCSWTIDTNTTGSVSLSIAVSGGDLWFADIIGNYSGYGLQVDAEGNAVITDGVYTVVTEPVDWYGALNNNTTLSDGKDNVLVDGATPSDARDIAAYPAFGLGDWAYKVYDGSTLTCDFYLDPELVILTADTTPPTP